MSRAGVQPASLANGKVGRATELQKGVRSRALQGQCYPHTISL